MATIRPSLFAVLIAILAVVLAPTVVVAEEPDEVTVKHVLIGFKKTLPGKVLDRTKREARELAEQILARAAEGEDFDALMETYSEDSGSGTYKMTNHGIFAPGAIERKKMAKSFGDVAFRLEVGEVGLAKYHSTLSPYGYHVIKRVE